jgi:hypothetical protein
MERGGVTQELLFFCVFFFGSLLIWALSKDDPTMFKRLLMRVFDFEVKAVLVALGPYLVFQLLRVTVFGLGRKV